MNHIKRLQMDLEQANKDKIEARRLVDDLRDYLSLPKFHEDTTVQVSDIFNRITPIRVALI